MTTKKQPNPIQEEVIHQRSPSSGEPPAQDNLRGLMGDDRSAAPPASGAPQNPGNLRGLMGDDRSAAPPASSAPQNPGNLRGLMGDDRSGVHPPAPPLPVDAPVAKRTTQG